MSGVPSKHKSGYQKRKEERLRSERKGLQTLFQVGVRANVCDNSSAASVIESTPEVGRTSDDDNQPSVSLSTEKANSSSLQDDFQTSEPKVKRIKSTESTQLSSIQTLPQTQGLLSVAALTYECDIGLWQDLTEEMRDYWCRKGSNDCLNETASIHNSIQIDGKQKIFFRKSTFYCSLPNGEKKKRNWLCYSPSTGKAFCFQCKLFSPEDSAFFRGSFCDWKNATQRMVAHESSKDHRDATMTLCRRAKASGHVNSLLIEHCQAERIYAKAVMERVVATIKFLAERSLAFRGNDQVIGSPSNGNFLGTLELLSQFDPFLAAHLDKYGNKGKGSIS